MHPRYLKLFDAHLNSLREQGRYRHFADVSRQVGAFPHAKLQTSQGQQSVVVWCSNDYLSMGQHPVVLQAMQQALQEYGAGAGGTRNIAGTCHLHVELEQALAQWYQKSAALIFSSGYVANTAALSTLGRQLPGAVIISDADNHASMIAGIKASGARKIIFRHNDLEHLASILQSLPLETPKIIAFESVYSMSGDFAPIAEICALAKRYQALTYLDEVHGVGLYGATGSGVAERDGVRDQVDVIQGTFGKALGVVGGFITADAALVDVVRSCAAPFIFTTAMPPVIAAGALASMRFLQQQPQMRQLHQARAARLKSKLSAAGLYTAASPSHIVPLMVRHARCCQRAAEVLLREFGIYVQPINYPTVPKGTERFRLTPGLQHSDAMMDALVDALQQVWAAHAIEQHATVA